VSSGKRNRAARMADRARCLVIPGNLIRPDDSRKATELHLSEPGIFAPTSGFAAVEGAVILPAASASRSLTSVGRLFSGRVGPAEFAELTAMSARHVARLRKVLDGGRIPGFALVGAGDAKGESVALLTDRGAGHEGRKQAYGSQFTDECEPEPIEDPEHVDERRKAMGLVPIAEYRKVLCPGP
jgi:hypothetical protein